MKFSIDNIIFVGEYEMNLIDLINVMLIVES